MRTNISGTGLIITLILIFVFPQIFLFLLALIGVFALFIFFRMRQMMRFRQQYSNFDWEEYFRQYQQSQGGSGAYHTQNYTTDQYNAACVELGVGPDCTFSEVNSAKRKLIRKWHPDRAETPEQVNEYTIKAQKINAAYDIIVKYRKFEG